MQTLKPQKLTLPQLMDKIQELSVLPHVVFKVLELSANTDVAASEIERAIIVDPGFSSKVLVMANSAAFGLPRKVTSIKEAIGFLGFRNLRNIALTVGAYDLFVGKTDRESLRRRAWWRQSIDSAVCARQLAKELKNVPPDEAYTCGLLHLIGKTLIDRYAGADYEKVMELVELGVADYVAERDTYGYSHADVASAATAKWGLPETLRFSLKYVDVPEATDPTAKQRATLALASWMASHAKDGKGDAPKWACEILCLDEARLAELSHTCVQAMSEVSMA
jgi:HD-like signal output (HDOD) protein